ncbi:MAG: bifunctional glutamine synthetase adenylyltransferase/deadenyltransferase, partial [Gammaproteobacteria bacterium]
MIEHSRFPEQWQSLLLSNDKLLESAKLVLLGSDYVSQWGQRNHERAQALITSGDLECVYDEQGFQKRLAVLLLEVSDETALQQRLRYFRQQEMVRIIWRDLAGWADLAETVRDLSAMA